MLPLTGVKVVELANNIAGPYAAYILAMLGADVLKVERPETGDDARAWGPPFWKDTSATFHALNVNKQGVTLDLKAAEHVAWLQTYIESCDVLVHNMRPGVLDEMGLGGEALRARNPRLVYCSLSAFGPKGPMQKNGGYEPMVQAFSGLFSINGYPGPAGVRIGASVLDLGCAVSARSAGSPAVPAARENRQGLRRRRLALRTALGLLTVRFARFRTAHPAHGVRRRRAVVLFQAVDTADGQIIVAAPNDQLSASSRPSSPCRIGQDARYRPTPTGSRARRPWSPPVAEFMRARTTAEWVERLDAVAVPASPSTPGPRRGASAGRGARHGPPVPEVELELISLPLSFGGERPDHPHARAKARRAQRVSCRGFRGRR